MARTYRDICNSGNAGNRRRRIDWWGDLPPPMKEAIEQLRTQFSAAIDSVEFRVSDRAVFVHVVLHERRAAPAAVARVPR